MSDYIALGDDWGRYWTNEMIFRLSQKLAKKMKVGALCEMPLDENPFADWSGNLFNLGRTRFIILSNTKSLYTCLMPAKGVTTAALFLERSLDTIRDVMEYDGRAFASQRIPTSSLDTTSFAKPLNRSVIGSMNELAFGANCFWIPVLIFTSRRIV